jgi:hypothetical protein
VKCLEHPLHVGVVAYCAAVLVPERVARLDRFGQVAAVIESSKRRVLMGNGDVAAAASPAEGMHQAGKIVSRAAERNVGGGKTQRGEGGIVHDR